MKFYIVLCLQAIIVNKAWSLPLLQNSPLLSNNFGLNNLPSTGLAGALNPQSHNLPNSFANSVSPNILANEPNLIGNSILTNEINSNIATITSANFVPIENLPSDVVNTLQMSPIISEVIPSLQYGDFNMAGDLPIGGTIKVCGCFPVYGTIAVDGNVPSTGTAVVAESFGNQIADAISKCANQVIL